MEVDAVVEERIALVGATVHDGEGKNKALVNALVIIKGPIIETVQALDEKNQDQVQLLSKVDKIIDVKGKHIIPGLIDCHVHYSQTGFADGRPDCYDLRQKGYPYPEVIQSLQDNPNRFHKTFLRCGVTSVFDVGGYLWTIDAAKKTINSSTAPRMKACGPLLSTWVPKQYLEPGMPSDRTFVLVKTKEDVTKYIDVNYKHGADAIKFWYIVNSKNTDSEKQLFHALCQNASEYSHSLSLPFCVHATELSTATSAVSSHCDFLVHSISDKPAPDALVSQILSQGIYYCPTLIVGLGYLQFALRQLSSYTKTQLQALPETSSDACPCVSAHVSKLVHMLSSLEGAVQGEGRRAWIQQYYEDEMVIMKQNLKKMSDRGVKIVMGTDAGNPLTLHGPSVWVEMEEMQSSGMSAKEVLKAATYMGGHLMGLGDKIGVVKQGAAADLVILTQDPEKDISACRTVEKVVKSGVVYNVSDFHLEKL